MASKKLLKEMYDAATCSICQAILKDSVSINCGHSFCRLCISNLIKIQESPFTCPLCRDIFQEESIKTNFVLQNIIELLQISLAKKCEEHGKELLLFCDEDNWLLCEDCESQHQGHSILPTVKAYEDYKEQLQETLGKLKKLDEKYESKKVVIGAHKEILKSLIVNQKKEIQINSKKFQNFLKDDEKSCLKILDEIKQSGWRDNMEDVKDTLKRSSAVQKLKFPEAVSLTHEMLRNISEINFDVNKIANRYQDLCTIKDSNADSTSQEESKAVSSRSGSITGPSSADMASKNSGDFTFNSKDKNSQKPNTGAIVPGTEATSYIGKNQEGSNEDSHFEPESIVEKQKQVTLQYKNFRNFVKEEEKSCLESLDKENNKILQELNDSDVILEKQKQERLNVIQLLKEKIQEPVDNLLQDVKDTLKRSSAVQKLKFPEAVSLTHEMLRNISEINFDVNKIANRYQDLYTIKDSNADSTSQEESKAVSSRSGSITGPSSADMASKNSGDFTFNSNDKNSQKPNTGVIVPGTEATSYIGENQEGSNEDSHFEPAVKDKAD